MNYTVLGISILRSLLITSAALTAAAVISGYLKNFKGKIPGIFYVLLILCFFMPPVGIGYGYSYFIFRFTQNQWVCTFIYTCIMISLLTPPAVLVLLFIPPAISASGLHTFKMTLKNKADKKGRSDRVSARLRFMVFGLFKPYTAAAALLFIISFSEFELASLMQIKNWSVKVFNSYAHGFPVFDSLKLALIPALIEFAAILLFFFTAGNPKAISNSNISSGNHHTVSKYSAITMISVIVTVIILLPMFMILRYAIPGMSIIFHEFWMEKEIANSAIFAISGACAAWFCASLLIKLYNTEKTIWKILSLFMLLPGLSGALPLGLFTLSVFQTGFLNQLYDTPVPLLTAMTFFLLPFAFILMILSQSLVVKESVHSALLINASPLTSESSSKILWHIFYRKKFWLFFLIFCRGFFDMTLSSILAPVRMPTVTVRLYNLMHYGESEKLSATVCLTILLPLLTVILLTFILEKIKR